MATSFPNVRVYVDLAADAFEEATTWSEVTDWALRARTRHGRSSPTTDFSPGGGTVTLVNTDGRFDPRNTSGAYYPDLLPRRRIKVEADLDEATYLVDTFSSGPSGSLWSTVGSGGVTVSGGLLQVTSATTVTTRGLSAVTATPFYDLTVKAEIVGMTATPWPTFATYYPIYLRMDAADTEAAWWSMSGGNIFAAWKQPSMSTQTVYSAAWSASLHLYLRVRRSGHTTYWESSSNGTSWTVRAQADVAWQHADTCTPRILAVTSSGEVSTDTLSLSGFRADYQATHALGYGWVKGWPQSQDGRKYGEVEVEWADALTVLARTELPDSVYDHVVRSLNPEAWYRLNDRTTLLEDSSGNSNHGWWGTMEEEQSGWWLLENRPLPTPVLEAGEADSVIPASGRPGKSWARMQAEIAQPIGGATQTPRVPVARAGDFSFNAPTDLFSVEVWLIFRQSFVIGETNTPTQAGAARQHQVLVQWGDNRWDNLSPPTTRWHFMIWQATTKAYPVAFFQNSTGAGDTFLSNSSINIDDGQPHQLVLVYNGATDVAVLYMDGAAVGSVTVTALNRVANTPAVLGGAWATSSFATNYFWHLQSLTGDYVFYPTAITSGQVEDLWYAGRYGTLTTDTELNAGQVIDQALNMVGWTIPTDIDTGGHEIQPDVPKRAGALEYIREAARSEQGAFYQAPDGTVTFLTSDWSATLSRAAGSHWQLSDDGSTELGFSDLEFDFSDESIVNGMTVDWFDGEQYAEDAGSVALYGHLRDSESTILKHPEDALQLAYWRVATQKEPRWLVSRPIVVEPGTPAEFAFCCSVQFGSRLTLTRTTPDGRSVTGDYLVQAVSHDIDRGRRWVTQLTLAPADVPGQLFTLDNTLIVGSGSPLDGDDVLAF